MMPWRGAVTELESVPGYSLTVAWRPQKRGPTPTPGTAARPLTSNEGALLPSLLQQQHVLQQGGMPVGAGVALQRHAQQAARDGGCAHELARQCTTLP